MISLSLIMVLGSVGCVAFTCCSPLVRRKITEM